MAISPEELTEPRLREKALETLKIVNELDETLSKFPKKQQFLASVILLTLAIEREVESNQEKYNELATITGFGLTTYKVGSIQRFTDEQEKKEKN